MLVKRIEGEIEYMQAEKQECPNGVCSLVKTAEQVPEIFDGVKLKKNHAYLYVIAMGSGTHYGENRNGDFFNEKDLIEYHKKFLTAGVFIQHDNKDPSKSIGKVLKAEYNYKMHRVELLIEIKKELAPEIYDAIANGQRIAVSMGVKTPAEHCSYCGHITKDSLANRCEHLKNMMHQIMPNGVKVYAVNHPPLNFFDISIVRKPADTQGYALFQKVASVDGPKTNEQKNTHLSVGDGLRKIAELTKRIEAWKVMPPLTLENIRHLRTIPGPLLKAIIISRRILMRPSEVLAFINPDIDREIYRDLSQSIDNIHGVNYLLKLSCALNGKTHEKIAYFYEDINDEVISKLIAREDLIKEAKAVSELSDTDPYGRKRVTRTYYESDQKKVVKKINSFFNNVAEIKVNMVNGDSYTFSPNNLTYYDVDNIIKTGAIASLGIVLPNGGEYIVPVKK